MSMTLPPAGAPGETPPVAGAVERKKRKQAERLANALRENLRRRKEQLRARRHGGDVDPTD